jgi:hypothetical protein
MCSLRLVNYMCFFEVFSNSELVLPPRGPRGPGGRRAWPLGLGDLALRASVLYGEKNYWLASNPHLRKGAKQ